MLGQDLTRFNRWKIFFQYSFATILRCLASIDANRKTGFSSSAPSFDRLCILACVNKMDQTSKPSSEKEEEVIKNKYGGLVPKKPPLISKDHERAYFDSADWALGKQGVEKRKGPLEALRPKLQPTQQQTRYRKSPCAPTDGEDGDSTPSAEDNHE
ncbi:hypothetical protein SSX86_022610 [Deinandra increscens subsp. villosa]|uniref:cAMP-regulated phosphoprotein 19-related protein n=1 Tax=Deinandra increscens subsp. villosa TaxID=3103831 RepID=A0AAP0CPJ9_9ASTR